MARKESWKMSDRFFIRSAIKKIFHWPASSPVRWSNKNSADWTGSLGPRGPTFRSVDPWSVLLLDYLQETGSSFFLAKRVDSKWIPIEDTPAKLWWLWIWTFKINLKRCSIWYHCISWVYRILNIFLHLIVMYMLVDIHWLHWCQMLWKNDLPALFSPMWLFFV